MTYIISGIALFNGLKLSNGIITCTAKRDENNQVYIKIKRHSTSIRKLFPILFLMLIYISISPNEANTPDTIIYSLFMPIILLMLILRFIPNLRLLNYHGAEHKVVVAYRNKLPLTLESIRPVSRITNLCGTMLVIPIVFYTFLLSIATLITNNVWIHSLLTIVVILSLTHYFLLRGEEIVYVNIKRLFPFLKNLFKNPRYKIKTNTLYKLFDKMGYLLQKHFTTRDPSDEELKVAILCMQKLVNAHNSQSFL